VVLVCVPPASIAPVIYWAMNRNLARTYSDVGSIKTQCLAEAERLGVPMARLVGGHPVAGRERGGPAAAQADLFLGRPWVLTPTPASAADALDAVRRLAAACGAVPVEMTPAAHDTAMALVSHAPQALASALAAALRQATPDSLALAGPGLRDVTRLADSDPVLWGQIAGGNAPAIAGVLEQVAARLSAVAASLRTAEAEAAFANLVADGNTGRARLPGKHGSRAREYATVPVVIADEPGILARLLGEAGLAGINVEDLSLEHSPGAPVGLCELVVAPEQASRLAAVLAERGWTVHPPSATVTDG
jgi:prephenate dehydrogenase